MKYAVGVDIGGTNIKTGIVGHDGCMVAEETWPTPDGRTSDEARDTIAEKVLEIWKRTNIPQECIAGVGFGNPGGTNVATGIIKTAKKLPFKDYPLRDEMEKVLPFPVYIDNDANVAALAEAVAGCARGTHSAVILTLGTGVGSGIVVEGKLLRGYRYGGGEFGHMVIHHEGRLCGCKKTGCFEAYCSATALRDQAKKAMAEQKDSLLWNLATVESVDCPQVFLAGEQGDAAAQQLVEEYITYLAIGVTNIMSGLQPEVIGIGGGVANQGEKLLLPLREAISLLKYGEPSGNTGSTRVELCTLGYHAGVIGAALLAMGAAGERDGILQETR